MKDLLCSLLILFFCFSVKANEDSLIVNSLLQQAKQTTSLDSSKIYANQAMDYAKKKHYLTGILNVAKHFGNQYAKTGNLEQSLKLYKTLVKEYSFDVRQLSTAYNQIGIYHVYMGHYDSTETYFLKALNMRKQLKDSLGIGASLNNLGNVIMTKGDYDNAISYYINALKIREAILDSAGIASSTNNLGMIFYKQKKFKEAIDYYQYALDINQKQKNLKKECLIINNLGNIYDEMEILDSSVYYYQKAIEKATLSEDARLIAMSYGNMGVTQQKLKNYESSKKYLNKALLIRRNSEDLEGQAILYNNLGGVYVSTNEYDSAIYFFNTSLSFSEKIDYKEATRDNYLGLSDAYKNLDQFENAYKAYQNYVLVKDSKLNETTTEQLIEAETKYETEKKEKEIAEQKVDLAEQQLIVKNRNYLLLGLILIVFFIIVVGLFIYKQQKLKQQKLLEENRLKDQIARIMLRNELHEERLRISRDLHDNIGSQLTFIISSVDNIKYLFKTVDEKLNNKLINISHFTQTTITQLRDTIWALNKDQISFEDLKSRLYNYIKNAELAQEETQFNFNEDLKKDFQLNSIEGVNIYRIVQEAINNAVKYAAAANVSLTISETSKEIVLSIIDDGIGFDISKVQLGNGLDNMKKRASLMGATFNLESSTKKGTSIVLSLLKNKLNAV